MAEDGSNNSHPLEEPSNSSGKSTSVDELNQSFGGLSLNDKENPGTEPSSDSDDINQEGENNLQGGTTCSDAAKDSGQALAGPHSPSDSDNSKENDGSLIAESQPTTSATEQIPSSQPDSAPTDGDSRTLHNTSVGPDSADGNDDPEQNPPVASDGVCKTNVDGLQDEPAQSGLTADSKCEAALSQCSESYTSVEIGVKSEENSSTEPESVIDSVSSQSGEPALSANTETESASDIVNTKSGESAVVADTTANTEPESVSDIGNTKSGEPALVVDTAANTEKETPGQLVSSPAIVRDGLQPTEDEHQGNRMQSSVHEQNSLTASGTENNHTNAQATTDSQAGTPENADPNTPESSLATGSAGGASRTNADDGSGATGITGHTTDSSHDEKTDSFRVKVDTKEHLIEPANDTSRGQQSQSEERNEPDQPLAEDGENVLHVSDMGGLNCKSSGAKEEGVAGAEGKCVERNNIPASRAMSEKVKKRGLSHPEIQRPTAEEQKNGKGNMQGDPRKWFEVSCNSTRMLEDLGFKHHYEQENRSSGMTVCSDHAKGLVKTDSLQENSQKLRNDDDKFLKDFDPFPLTFFDQLEQKLVGMTPVQEFLALELLKDGIKCHFTVKRGVLKLVCRTEHFDRCKNILRQNVCLKTFQVENEQRLSGVEAKIKSEKLALCEREGLKLHVATTYNVAQGLFSKLEEMLSPDRTGRLSPSSHKHSGAQAPQVPVRENVKNVAATYDGQGHQGLSGHRQGQQPRTQTHARQELPAVHTTGSKQPLPPEVPAESTIPTYHGPDRQNSQTRHVPLDQSSSPLTMEPHGAPTFSASSAVKSGSNVSQPEGTTEGLTQFAPQPSSQALSVIQNQSHGNTYKRSPEIRGVTVTTPDVVSDIVKRNRIVQEHLALTLSKQDVYLDGKGIEKGLFMIAHGDIDSIQKVEQLLQNMFLREEFPQHLKDELKSDLTQLCRNHSDTCSLTFAEEKNLWRLTYYREISKTIEPVLNKIRYKDFRIPLPGYLLSHVKSLIETLRTAWNQGGHGAQAWFSAMTASDGLYGLSVKADRTVATAAQQHVFSLLEKTIFRGKQIHSNTGHILQRKQSVEFIKALEAEHHSTIRVQTPENHVLLHGWSPEGHQVMLCKNRLQDTDADLLVIPLCDRQKDWPPTHRSILEKSFLSTSMQRYVQAFKSQEQQKPLELNCSGELAGKRVMLMAVSSDGKNKDFVREALIKILRSAEPRTTIAVGMMFSPNIQLRKMAKTILHTLTVNLASENTVPKSLVVKLCFEPNEASDGIDFGMLGDHLKRMGWASSGSSKRYAGAHERVRVVVQELLSKEADVLVHSTDPELKHGGGIVSKMLLEKTGKQLLEKCRNQYPNGLSENVVAVTDSCGLKNIKKIYHVALPQKHWPNQSENADLENKLLAWLKVLVQSCLTMASAQGFRSIAFPSLGTGTLQYPPWEVAWTMVTEIADFFKEMPYSSLQDVYICCYHKDTEIIKAFQAVETFCSHQVNSPWSRDPDARARGAVIGLKEEGWSSTLWGGGKDSVVQIVEDNGQVDKRADLVIIANSRGQEKWQEYRQAATVRTITKPNKGLKDEIKKVLEKRKDLTTVRIYLRTFETKHFSDVVHGVIKGLTGHQHVVLIVPEDEYEILVECMKNECGQAWEKAVCYPAAEQSAASLQRIPSCVQVCGEKNQVAIVLKKISAMNGNHEDGSPVDPDLGNGPGSSMVDEGVGSGNEAWEHVSRKELPGSFTLSIPLECVRNLDVFLKQVARLNPLVQKESSVPRVKFCLESREEWKSAFEQVHEYIHEHDMTARPDVSSAQIQQQPHTQAHSLKALTREVDSVVADALRTLMKEDFSKVQEDQMGKDKVKLSCTGASAQNTLDRIDSLRQEEFPLGQDDLQKIPAPLDTTEDGVAAYLVPIPPQGKVIIFSFDYNAVSKAKHLLNVKLGKVKVTTRARRRFEGKGDTAGNGSSGQSPPSSLGHTPSSTEAAEFKTISGITVSVYKTDITKLPVDGIVNAANEHLAHGGGVAYAIARAAGFELEDEGQEHIKKHGPLKVREVLDTTAGSLTCKKVLHAVGPRWSDYKDKAVCQQHLVDTVYNCLHKADSLKMTSLAIPSISAAIFGVPKEVCAISYLCAVQCFDKEFDKDTSLRQIHFVDVNDDMITTIQKTFREQWNTDLTSRGGAATAHEVSDTGSRSAGNIPPSRLASAGATNDMSTTRSKGPYTEEKTESTRFEVHRTDRGESEYHCHFQDLVLYLKCQNVTDPFTDALVLWQETGSVARDENFRQFASFLSQKAQGVLTKATSGMPSADGIRVVELDARVVLFPVVSPYSTPTADSLQQMIESCLDTVNSRRKASVAVPTYPRTLKDSKDSNLAVTNFAKGIYAAVQKFSKQHTSVTQVHVISPDSETIRTMAYTVSQLIAMEKSLQGVLPSPAGPKGGEAAAKDCVICHDGMTDPKTLECGHTFCTHCIDRWFSDTPRCPCCQKAHGILTGNQPTDGTMKMRVYSLDVLGHKGCGSLEIQYSFTGGTQTAQHPYPGRRYSGTTRTAYLPNTREGRTVLMLLKTAFDRRLIFTVGQSSTTGHVGVIWNDIHHKTSRVGGGTMHGYPDPEYLTRVTRELADNGVTEKDLTDTQKAFIENPNNFTKGHYADFSFHFSQAETLYTTV